MDSRKSRPLFVIVLIVLAFLLGWMKFSMYRGIISRALEEPNQEQEAVPVSDEVVESAPESD